MSARKELYDYVSNIGLGSYHTEDLRRVTSVDDWARVFRQLRQDGILEYTYDKSTNHYQISFIGEYSNASKRSGISAKDRYRIRNRDGHRCQACGKGVENGVKLHVDHKVPLDWGGSNLDDNLWTLCAECNLGKKSFFEDDFDAEIMKRVMRQTSGMQKLKVLFENSPNKKFTPAILQGIAGIRDWTRTLRHIRNKLGMNILWVKPDENNPNGYYVYEQ